MVGRTTSLFLVGALLFLTSCSVSSTGSSSAPPPSSSGHPADTGPFVTTQGQTFIDRTGRPVVLRGVDVHSLDPTVYQQAAALGANFMRVAVPWSDYEPLAPTGVEHHWNESALAQLDALVRFCDGAHISVLLDFHQHGWSPYFSALAPAGRANGIPAWFYADGRYPDTAGGLDRAKRDFFQDTVGAELYGQFAQMIANRYRDSPSVMGYEILNEPDPGDLLPRNHATTQLVVGWESGILADLRAVDPVRTVVFMTRGGPSMGALHANLQSFGSLEHLALDVHDYFGGTGGSGYKPNGENVSSEYTSTLVGQPYSGTAESQAEYLQVDLDAARRWDIPMIVGEWGAKRTATGLGVYQAQMVHVFASLGLSWARWSLDPKEPLGLLTRDGAVTPAAQQLERLLAGSTPTG